MPSIFTKIIQREIPAHIIAEDEKCIAFLDVNPLRPGHTLVIPKLEIDRFFDLDPELLARLMRFAQQVSYALEKAVECKKIGVAVIGLEVPHAHVHLIPIQKVSDMDFSQPKLKVAQEELSQLSQKIRQFMNA
jgi:histidine triad (HIT) family protein